MDDTSYLAHLESDYRRLAEVASGRLDAPVPTCPDWTVRDLVSHVAHVYLHKVANMTQMRDPEPWPPDFGDVAPLDLLDRGYRELRAEFDARPPDSGAHTWYKPDQTVRFWYRRMAQETVIHRVDAERAACVELAPIDADLAADGIDEVLRIFLGWGSTEYADYMKDLLGEADGRSIAIRAGSDQYVLTPSTAGVRVSDSGEAHATITGEPVDMLLWLWNRGGTVEQAGDPELLHYFHRLMVDATQ